MVYSIPSVSIIMPAFNAEDDIARAIDSVLSQTYADWELIVVDDASRDATCEIARRYASQDARVRILRNTCGKGVASARNCGLESALGRYVAFLDSDDAWCPEKLRLQVSHLRQEKSSVTYGMYRRISVDKCRSVTVIPPSEVKYERIIKTNDIGMSTALYDVFKLPNLRFYPVGNEDYLFWIEAIRSGGVATLTPSEHPLADYLVRKGSLSSDKLRSVKWQWLIYREQLSFNLFKSLIYIVIYIYYAASKRVRINRTFLRGMSCPPRNPSP